MKSRWSKAANIVLLVFLLSYISQLTADQSTRLGTESPEPRQAETETEGDLAGDFPQPPPVPFTTEPSVAPTTFATSTTSTSTPSTTPEVVSTTTSSPLPIQRIKIFPVYRKGVGYCCRDVRKSNGKKQGKEGFRQS